MFSVILGIGFGLLFGIFSQTLTVTQLSKRTNERPLVDRLKKPTVLIGWCVLTAAISALVFYSTENWVQRLEYLIFVALVIGIGVIDASVKKIPNDSLLVLLAVKVIAVIIEMFMGGTFVATILPPLLGFFIGTFLYLIPSMLHIPIGAGDIKFCAVIGFILGIYGFLKSVIIMALSLLIYLCYLKASKKGSLRTSAPMGPFLALGVIITILFPVQSLINFI